MASKSVSFHDPKGLRKTVSLKVNQVTKERLSIIFQLKQDTIFLAERSPLIEGDPPEVLTAEKDETFDLDPLYSSTDWDVRVCNLPGIASQFANQILGTANQLRNAEQKTAN